MMYLRAKDGLIFSICTTQEERKERKELKVVVFDDDVEPYHQFKHSTLTQVKWDRVHGKGSESAAYMSPHNKPVKNKSRSDHRAQNITPTLQRFMSWTKIDLPEHSTNDLWCRKESMLLHRRNHPVLPQSKKQQPSSELCCRQLQQ